MRQSQTLIPTLKEAPSEAEVPSHIFMVRGGYLRKVAAGIYSFLPLGWRVVKKVERIIREEMDRSGASEVFLPAVIPAELWKESGRWQNYGDQLLRFKDRKGGDFVIGPTHEEVISALVRGEVRSWRQLKNQTVISSRATRLCLTHAFSNNISGAMRRPAEAEILHHRALSAQ